MVSVNTSKLESVNTCMNHHPGNNQEEDPHHEAHDILDKYVFDNSGGIYIPRSHKAEDESRTGGDEFQIAAPLDVKVRRDKAALVISILTLIGIVYTVYLTRSTYTEIHQQTAYAGSVADAARHTLSLDQRAWLGVDSIDGQFNTDQRITIEARIKNSGKTPAINVNSTSIAEFLPRGQRPRFSVPPEIRVHTGMAMPESIVPIVFDSFAVGPGNPHVFGQSGRPVIATGEIIDLMRAHKVVLFVHGTIDYQDIFYRQHWTTWCAFDHPTTTRIYLERCGDHNDTDDSQIPKSSEPSR